MRGIGCGYVLFMEPIPETLEAIGELDPHLDDGTLVRQLRRRADGARVIAPGVVGVSVTARAHGVTYTLVASDEATGALDGVQYLASGPCVDGLAEGQGRSTTLGDLLSEPRWHAFGLAGAAAGVRSTLTFPIVDDREGEDGVVGTVNIYGADEDTFTGKHEQLAAVFGAWAPGAVTNADLSFTTRHVAEQAPDVLRDRALVEVATGIVAAVRHIDLDVALAHLEEAARQAGVSLPALARRLLHEPDTS